MAATPHGQRSPSKTLLSTTILASNIHCASCVSHIQDIVQRSKLSHAIVCTNVSIVSGEIQLLHDSQLPVKSLCREIADAAFEVHSSVTVDEHDKLISEFTFDQDSDGFLADAADRLRSSLQRSPDPRASPWNPSTPLRNKRKRHIENCQACQSKGKHAPFESATSVLTEKVQAVASLSPDASSSPVSTTSAASTFTRDFFEALDASSPCPRRTGIQNRAPTGPAPQVAEMIISGMTCASCTNAITNVLLSLEKVDSVQVVLLNNSATIHFSGTEDYEDALREAVEDAGFEVTSILTKARHSTSWPGELQLEKSIRPFESQRTVSDHSDGTVCRKSIANLFKANFSIAGMTCSACTSSITDVLSGLPSVKSVTISLMTNSARVVFQGHETIHAIITAIEDMGFDCAVEPDSVLPESDNVTTPVAEDDVSEVPTSRSIQIMVQGFYCGQCPTRVARRLEEIYGDSIHVDKTPTLEQPIVSLSYIPDLSRGLSARSVIHTLEAIDEQGRFRAKVYHSPSLEEKSRQVQRAERKKLLLRLLASIVVVIPTFVIGVVCMSLLPAQSSARRFFMQPMWAGQVPRAEWALFILATPVYFFVADVFHKRAIKEIRALWRRKSRVPIIRRFIKFGSMNLLVSAGTTVAYCASLGVLIMSATMSAPNQLDASVEAMDGDASSSTYFDMVVFLTFFILIGRYLEAYSKAKAGDAISMLGNLRPETAIIQEGSGEQLIVPSDQLEVGDTILVRYGESPAADGILVDAEGRFDESSLTGESRPARKVQGEKVFTGTINLGSPVYMKVHKIGGTSMLDQIIAVVREGQVRRAPVEQIADIITGYFVPVITALAILTFAIWISLGYSGKLDPKYLKDQQGGWAFWSLEFAIAVFVVACPCGIGLAAPTALFVGGGLAAKHGILARGGGQAFQDAGSLDAIVFDKTGTLTEGGDLKVTDLEYRASGEDESTLMAIAHRLETSSSHPVAAAIATASLKRFQDVDVQMQIMNLQEIPGHGIEGTFQTQSGTLSARIGSIRYITPLCPTELSDPAVQKTIKSYEQQAKTVCLFATRFTPSSPSEEDPGKSSHQLTAMFAIEDAIRPSALPAVTALIDRGLDVYMVSGDNATTAHSVAARVGIKPENVFAQVLPTEKAQVIELLRENLQKQSRGARTGRVNVGSPLRRVFVDRGAIREREKAGSSTGRTSGETVDVEAQIRPTSGPAPVDGRDFALLRGTLGETSHLASAAEQPHAQSSCHRARIAFVGDGINDAPALSRADVSISPSNGSPIAMTSSSFILMSPSLLAIPRLLDISTRVFRRVRFNFAWALLYNVVLIPVAAGVFFKITDDGWRLGPVWGSLAMALSSVSVVLSSLALRWEGRGGL